MDIITIMNVAVRSIQALLMGWECMMCADDHLVLQKREVFSEQIALHHRMMRVTLYAEGLLVLMMGGIHMAARTDVEPWIALLLFWVVRCSLHICYVQMVVRKNELRAAYVERCEDSRVSDDEKEKLPRNTWLLLGHGLLLCSVVLIVYHVLRVIVFAVVKC